MGRRRPARPLAGRGGERAVARAGARRRRRGRQRLACDRRLARARAFPSRRSTRASRRGGPRSGLRLVVQRRLEAPAEPDRGRGGETASRTPRRIAAWSASMRASLDLFESLLDGRDYLYGDFGVADVIAFPFLKYAVLGVPGGRRRALPRDPRRAPAARRRLPGPAGLGRARRRASRAHSAR